MTKVVIISPCYNEEEIISDFVGSLIDKIEGAQIILVDDGSTDRTAEIISENKNITLLQLESNLGQQAALVRGLEHIKDADIIVTLDSDLQDDPQYINEMISLIRQGHDYVAGIRVDRSSDTFFKRIFASYFYWLIKRIDENALVNHGDYRAMSGELLRKYFNSNYKVKYLRGQLPSLAENIAIVEIIRKKRTKGKTKYTLLKMLKLAASAFQSLRR